MINYTIENVNNKSFNNYTYLDNDPKHALGNVNIFLEVMALEKLHYLSISIKNFLKLQEFVEGSYKM